MAHPEQSRWAAHVLFARNVHGVNFNAALAPNVDAGGVAAPTGVGRLVGFGRGIVLGRRHAAMKGTL